MPQLAEVAADIMCHPDVQELAFRLHALEQHYAELPGAVRVQDLPEEDRVQAEFARGLGALTMGQTVETATEEPPHRVALLEYINRAVAGDRNPVVETARLSLIEAITKRGVAEVRVTRDASGRLVQHGVPLDDVVAKAIELHPGDHPNLHRVTRGEGLYMHTWDTLEDAGYFDKGYVWVTYRQAPRSVPGSSLKRYGYFENLAVAGAVVWKDPKTGEYIMRSVFVDGTAVDDTEEAADRPMGAEEVDAMYEARLTRRHDEAGVSNAYARHGLRPPESTYEAQRGFLVHISQFDNQEYPEADAARWYDDGLGPDYFYGRTGGRSDYVEFSRQCLRLRSEIDPLAEVVADELIANRHAIPKGDDMAAATMLAQIARRHAIDYVLEAPHVDARAALGLAGAAAAQAYQQAKAAGDQQGMQIAREAAHTRSRVNMCGFGDTEAAMDHARRKEEESADGSSDATDRASTTPNTTTRCSYEFKSCYCSPYDYKGNQLDEPVEVLVVKDQFGIATCKRSGCGAMLKTVYDRQGNVLYSYPISKGGIFALAQQKAGAKH